MKTYFREADGHTYFLSVNGDLMACPTNADNTPDFENWVNCDSLSFMDDAQDSGFSADEANRIREFLTKNGG